MRSGFDLLDERQLVEQARHDADAFAALYRRYVDRIHAFAWRRTRSTTAAEDVTSATFEKALRGLAGYRWREPGIGPWLFRIAANELIDRHRRDGRDQKVVQRLDRPVPGPDHPGRRLEAADELRRALDRLPPRYQRALTLRWLADLTNEEVAAAMGVSKATMAVVLHRAMASLRRELGATTTEVPADA